MNGSATTASRSISTRSTTAPTSSARRQHSARRSWIYIDGEVFQGARADIAGDAKEPWVNIAWKYLYTAKDFWLGSEANLGSIGATYNLTMDPYEKYDMTFNGAAPTRVLSTSPGKYAGQDNGWVLALVEPVIAEFDKSIMKFPNTQAVRRRRLQRLGSEPPESGQSGSVAEGPDGAGWANRTLWAAAADRRLSERRGGFGRPFLCACRHRDTKP